MKQTKIAEMIVKGFFNSVSSVSSNDCGLLVKEVLPDCKGTLLQVGDRVSISHGRVVTGVIAGLYEGTGEPDIIGHSNKDEIGMAFADIVLDSKKNKVYNCGIYEIKNDKVKKLVQ